MIQYVFVMLRFLIIKANVRYVNKVLFTMVTIVK